MANMNSRLREGKEILVHNMRAYTGVEVRPSSFLTVSIDGASGQLYALAALHPVNSPK
jgi:hypothetical protein